jgi:cytochrome c oxidase subunit 1
MNGENNMPAAMQRPTLVWMGIAFVVFVLLMMLGLIVRSFQAQLLPANAQLFYSLMTLHGDGMAGLIFVSGMVLVGLLIARYVNVNPTFTIVGIVATLVGVLLLAATTLLGKLATGWYFLYPLVVESAGTWGQWAGMTYLLGLTVLDVGWLVWTLGLIKSVASKYSLTQALGWQYFRGTPLPEIPPVILISTVSFVIVLVSLSSGALLVPLYFLKAIQGTHTDPLLMKNLTFFFGHLLVNLSMYLGVAVVYELLPHYTSRPWKTSRPVVIAWNLVLFIVLLATFHHMYMDFVQPLPFQFIGQVASYAAALPAAVMSIYGLLVQVYRARMKWSIASVFFVLGFMGWAIGGVAAVIDATIRANFIFHNTLWVPAHFHTYNVMGLVLLIFGGFSHCLEAITGLKESEGMRKFITTVLLIGGYGFLLMFYVSGVHGVPRRFAVYPHEVSQGTFYARVSVVFIGMLMAGMLMLLVRLTQRWFKALSVVFSRG